MSGTLPESPRAALPFVEAVAVLALLAAGASLFPIAIELLRVGILGLPWNEAGFAALAGAAAIACPALLGALALVGRNDVPAGARVDEPALRDAVAGIAARVGVRPPDDVRIAAEPGVELVHAGRAWSARVTLVLGASTVTGLGEDELGALVAHELLRYGQRTRLASIGRALTDLVRPRPMLTLSGSIRFAIFVGLVYLLLSAIPAAVAAGALFPLAWLQRRRSRRAEERADAKVAEVFGASALADARARLDYLRDAWVPVVLAAKREASSWRFVGDVADLHAERVARTRAIEGLPAASGAALSERVRAEAGADFAHRVLRAARLRRLVSRRPASRHPVGFADLLDATGGALPADPVAAAELASLTDDALIERLIAVHDPAVDGRSRARVAAERELALLTRFWSEAPGDARYPGKSQPPLTPYRARPVVEQARIDLAERTRAVLLDVARISATHHEVARRLGAGWARAEADAVRLVRFVAQEQARLVRLHESSRRMVGANARWTPAVREAWTAVGARLAAVSAPGVPGFPRLGAEPLSEDAAGARRLEAEVIACLNALAVAGAAARDHLVDLQQALAATWLAARSTPCPVPPLTVPELAGPDPDPIEEIRQVGLPKRAPVAVRGEIRAWNAALGAAVAAALLVVRILAGATRVVAYDGSLSPMDVELGGSFSSLQPHGTAVSWWFVPGRLDLAAATGGERVDEASLEVGFAPRQLIYNVGGRGFLIEDDVVYSAGGEVESDRAARVLGVDRVLRTRADYVLTDPPNEMQIDRETGSVRKEVAQDLAEEDVLTLARVLAQADPVVSEKLFGQGFPPEQMARAAGELALAALALDPPSADTDGLEEIALGYDGARAQEGIDRARQRWRTIAQRTGTAADRTRYARLLPVGSDERASAVDEALAADPAWSEASCLRGEARAVGLDWAGAATDWDRCAEGSPDVAAEFVLLRVFAARIAGRPVDALLAGAAPDLRALFELPPGPGDPPPPASLGARLRLAHGDLAGALAALPPEADRTREEWEVALLVGLSDGAARDPDALARAASHADPSFWTQVASHPLAFEPCDRAAVDAVAREASPSLQGSVYAAAAGSAGDCRPPGLAERARLLSVPGRIPFLR